MEEKVLIPTADKKIIYGRINWQGEKSRKLILFIHGLNGSERTAQMYNAARFFSKRGFVTLRINLYKEAKKARVLHECSIKTHSEDINTVLNFVKGEYDEIHLVGHSLAGPSIIGSSQTVNSVVLWDPSLVFENSPKDHWEYVPEREMYIVKSSSYTLVNKELYEGWKSSGVNMIEKMKVPTKIITGSEGPLFERWEAILDKIPVEYTYKKIIGAGHEFSEGETMQELFEETLKWFEKRT
jgi:predicted alpha/beta-fold hydrolase